jgi:phytol kinase
LCWLLFDDQSYARYLAALVPLATTIQFALVGLGIMKDDAAVKAMSRTGQRQEILRGPLFYGLAFVFLTILFWKDNPIGIIALMILCGGDGLADIIGKRFNTWKLPWSQNKTWAGSLSMFLGGVILSLLVLWVFALAGVFIVDWSLFLPRILLLGVLATLVESLPLRDLDNLTVPVVTVLAGLFLV